MKKPTINPLVRQTRPAIRYAPRPTCLGINIVPLANTGDFYVTYKYDTGYIRRRFTDVKWDGSDRLWWALLTKKIQLHFISKPPPQWVQDHNYFEYPLVESVPLLKNVPATVLKRLAGAGSFSLDYFQLGNHYQMDVYDAQYDPEMKLWHITQDSAKFLVWEAESA